MKTTDYIPSGRLLEESINVPFTDFRETFKSKWYGTSIETNKYSSILFKEISIVREISYIYDGKLIGVIPIQLEFLVSAFKESESILNLENDWDDNGSLKYDINTWRAAIEFLIDYSSTLLNDFNTIIDKPKIYNGPSGSIDILWEYDSYTLLVNINKDCLNASFYADNTINTQRIRGEFKLDNFKKTLIPFAIRF